MQSSFYPSYCFVFCLQGLVILFIFLKVIFYLYEFLACPFVSALCKRLVLQRPENGITSPGTGVRDG